MAETTTVARPYARAAFEYAQASEGGLKAWSELLTAAAAVAAEPAMQNAFADPAFSIDERMGLILDIVRAATGDRAGGEEFGNFIRLLAESRRLALLPEIAAMFEVLRTQAERSIRAELITAFPIDDAQQARIAQALSNRYQREVELEVVVDEDLIGGAIIRAGDEVIDGSARGHLANFAAALRH